MSNKGNKLTDTTRRKIALSKTRITKEHLMASALIYINQLNETADELPTLQGFCLVAGLSPSNLTDYRIKYPEVDQLCDLITTNQEQYLLTRAINNKANPIFAMFLLKSKHSYHDAPQQLTQNNTFNVSPELLADALKLMSGKNDKT